MSDKLDKQIAVTREELNLLFESFRSLLAEVSGGKEPSLVEVSALGGVLHSFYTGAENIFKRIAVLVDGGAPRGQKWHTELLGAMAVPTENRPPVISEGMHQQLSKYLDFRHFFRHGYTYALEWPLMAPLVLACEQTFRALEAELDEFLKARNSGN